jgi:hypothetical protein
MHAWGQGGDGRSTSTYTTVRGLSRGRCMQLLLEQFFYPSIQSTVHVCHRQWS